MDRETIEYEPNPEDEREEPLEEEEPSPPPTLDPEERVEDETDAEPGLDDDREV